MNNTTNLIKQALNKLGKNYDRKELKGTNYLLVPTLQVNTYQPISPMLKERFKLINNWEDATHADWLSIDEMEQLWENKPISNQRMKGIKLSLDSHIENWENNLGSYAPYEQLSLFAGSAYTYEHIYLFWGNKNIEPELWVYDVNGETRFDNLDEYLIDFLSYFD